jgi:hypothetical protein
MQSIQVGERELRIHRFKVRHGLAVLARLSTLIGPAAIRMQGEGALAGITDLCERMKPADLDWLIDELAEQTEVQLTDKGWVKLSLPGIFDVAFGTNYRAVLDWIAEGLKLNFADFLASIGMVLVAKPEPST